MRLLGDRVLVAPDERTPPSTESGITLAEGYYWAPEVTGTVIERGEGPRAEDGTLLAHYVELNDRVVFAPESGHEVVIADERFIILREDDLLAVLV